MKLKPELIQYLIKKEVNYYVLRELGVEDKDLSPRDIALTKINSWFEDDLCQK